MTIWPALGQVLGLFLLCSTASGFESSVYGPTCDFPNTARCLSGATCVAPQHCACAQGLGVDGTFFCATPSEQSIELAGFQNTFQAWNTSLEAPYPLACRSRLTEFVVEKPAEGRTCTFQIFGENKVVNQKVLVVAAEVHLKVEENGQVMYERGLRLTPGMLTSDQSYQYLTRTKNFFTEENPETYIEYPDDSELINSGSGMGEFLDDEDGEEMDMDFQADSAGPSDDEDSLAWSSPASLAGPGTQHDGILSKQVDVNSVAIIGVDDCNSEIRFRGADDVLIGNGLPPGLAVIIDQSVDAVHFSQAQSYIAGTPLSDLNSNLRQDFSLSQSQILLHTSMTYAAVQEETDAGELCRDTSFVYRAYCDSQDKKIAALKKCSPLVTDDATRSCLDTMQYQNGGSLQVFKQCMWVDCSPTFTVCNTLRSELNADACLDSLTKSSLLANCPP